MLPLQRAQLVLLLLGAVAAGTCGGQPIPSGNIFDWMVRGATRLGRVLSDPIFAVARGLTQTAEQAIVRDPDVGAASKGVPFYIKYKGYPAEVHKVITKDNVTLTVHRIPRQGAVPVILQHGVMCSSFDFVANLPSQSLGFILWDAGYDVWMMNARGNTYSRDSDKTRPRFYEYTWDDLAAYDLPATIDHVLKISGYKNLHLISHSRGTTVTVAMLSAKPEYNDKIRLATMLSPVVYLDGMSQFLQDLIKFFSNPLISYATDVLTEDRPVFSNSYNDPSYFTSNPTVCSLGLCPIGNDLSGDFLSDHGHHNKSRLAVYSTHFPAGTTYNDLKHYMQLHRDKRFAYYDFEDPQRNMKAYGKSRPPAYELSNVRAKMLIFYSKYDSFVSVRDGRRVVKLFRNNLYKETAVELPHPGFVHMDFLWGINAKEHVYDTVLRRMKEIDGENESR